MRKFLTLLLSFILIFFFYSNISNFSDFKKKIQKKVHKIVIHGLDNINENMILRKISLKEDQSFWDFNPEELKKDLQKIKGIKNFSFKMKSDGVLNIFITEEEPFMIWRFSNKIKYLNEKGEILDFDKKDHAKQVKKNMKPFEELFFGVGAEILKNMSGFLAVSPDKAVQKIKQDVDSALKDLRKPDNVEKLNKLKLQIEKLEAIGGSSAIVPSEGLVFKYKGNIYKFTGAFAPINQILGSLRF